MSLERLVQNRFFQPLVTGVLASILGCASPSGGKGLQESCGSDMECADQYVCDAQKCVGGSEASCGNDYDCSSTYVCEQGKCVSGGGSSSGNVGGSSVPVAKTPQEAYTYFTTELKKNNVESAVQYISPHVRERYKDLLSNANMVEIAKSFPSLEGKKPTISREAFIQYDIIVGDEEYSILFDCYHGNCTIKGL